MADVDLIGAPPPAREVPVGVTAEAPRPRVSGGDIARSYGELARGEAGLGQGLEDLATPIAEAQAASDVQNQKVTLGPDGKPQIMNQARSLIFGPAGDAYAKTVQQGTAAQIGNLVDQGLTDIHAKHLYDPQGEAQAQQSFLAGLKGATGNPVVDNVIQMRGAQRATEHLDNNTEQTARLNLANQERNLTAQLNNEQEWLANARRGGLSVNDPEYQRHLGQRDAALQGLQDSPTARLPPDLAARQKTQMDARLGTEELLGKIPGIVDSQGMDEARRQVDAALARPDLPANERRMLTAEAHDILNAAAPAWRAQNEAYRAEVNKLTTQSHPDMQELNDALVYGRRHNYEDLGRLEAFSQTLPDMQRLGKKTPAQRQSEIPQPAPAPAPAPASAAVATPAAQPAVATPAERPAVQPAAVTAGASAGAPVFQPPADMARLPAGMRNNNPGNIKFNASLNWQGQVGPSRNTDQGDPQVVFDTPENGMRAAYRLALQKYERGARTADQLVAGNGGWTPGNHTAAANIARTAGLGPNDDLHLDDPAHAARFLRGLILQEHGPASERYSDKLISNAVQAGGPTYATGHAPAGLRARAEGIAPAATGGVGGAVHRWSQDEIEKNPWLLYFESQKGKDPSESMAQFNAYVESAKATMRRDEMPGNDAMLTIEQFHNDNPDDARISHAYAEYRGMLDAQMLARMPADQAAATMSGMAAAARTSGDQFVKERAAVMQSGLAEIDKNWADKPVGTAQRFGYGQASPLNLTDPRLLRQAIKDRGAIAQAILGRRGEAVSIFDNGPETAMVKSALQTGDMGTKLLMMDELSNLPQSIQAATLNKLGRDPDIAGYAVAGSLMRRNQPQAAQAIMMGEDLLAKELRLAPKEDTPNGIAANLKISLPLTDFAPGDPTTRNQLERAVRDVYATLSAQANDLSQTINPDRLKAALTMVTGGVYDYRGNKVVAPWYNAAPDEMDRAFRAVTDDDLKNARTWDGHPVTAAEMSQRGWAEGGWNPFAGNGLQLESRSPGQYYLYSGSADAKQYLRDAATGNKFVLDLGSKQGVATQPTGTVIRPAPAPQPAPAPEITPPAGPTAIGPSSIISQGPGR